ncbi:hypothetical protein ABC383_22175 [Noviherbaspirillum sp. 1P10PC]|uniref:hypothetical protein n=1 Tax=Noviherbaspirillum sp. 1P10PC TaxID=3132292 RepID=UPI0039A343EE
MNTNSEAGQRDCEKLGEPRSFSGWNDFDAFVALIKASDDFLPKPVISPHSNVGLDEHWYQCSKCEGVWRLVEPDPPFAGLWERVS